MSDSKSKEIDFDALRFIRVFTPQHIPKYLIEQVKDRTYDVDDWYEYLETISLRQTDAGPRLNPLSLLYVIADEDNQVIGMLWCEIDALSKALIIQTFSMDRKYWLRGKAVKLLTDKGKEIVRECKLKKAYWFTNYPKHSERYGFKKSRSTLMEYTEKEDGRDNDGVSEAQGECPSGNGRAVGLSDASTSRDGAGSTTSDSRLVAGL